MHLLCFSGRIKVWRKTGEPQNTIKTVKHGGGDVMVWGCMAASGVGNLEIIEEVMDNRAYIEILKQNLKPRVEKLGVSEAFNFQQDNDPKHMAHNTRMYLAYNVPLLLEAPPQSPDLNPIEYIWNLL